MCVIATWPFFVCLIWLFVENERFQRRHSALRTINGGICCGLTFLPPRLTQLLLLGYQGIVNSLGFKGILCFLSLPISLSTSFVSKAITFAPSSYRSIRGTTFANCPGKGPTEMPSRNRGADFCRRGYLICLQLTDCPSSPSNSTRLMSHPTPGCFLRFNLVFISREGL